jgi:RimJ/RimL family protein N-acetyltransferase
MTTILELVTQRLRLRQWRPTDRTPFAALNADPVVMEFYPSTHSREESDAAADRIEARIAAHGWGLWAVELLDGEPFIGFIGLSVPQDLPFCPCVEIGWRLARVHWGRGYATEGAQAVLNCGFSRLRVPEIVSFTTVTNVRSRSVMERIGMRESELFDHPKIPVGHPLKPHVLYRISATQWTEGSHGCP